LQNGGRYKLRELGRGLKEVLSELQERHLGVSKDLGKFYSS